MYVYMYVCIWCSVLCMYVCMTHRKDGMSMSIEKLDLTSSQNPTTFSNSKYISICMYGRQTIVMYVCMYVCV